MANIQVTDSNIDSVLNSLVGLPVVIDTETTSIDILKAKIVHIQFGALDGTDVYWATDEFIKKIFASLATHSPRLILHNGIYDYKGLYWGYFEPDQDFLELMCSKMFDTRIGLKLLDENADADLDSWVQANHGDNYKEVFWSRNKNYHQAPLDEQIAYSCADIVYTRLLYTHIVNHPETVPTLLDHVQNFNQRLLVTSVGGLILDRDYLLTLGTELSELIVKGRIDLFTEAQHDTDMLCMEAWGKLADSVKTPKAKANRVKPIFNWSSSRQIMTLLYDRLNLPVQMSAKTKSRTVDDEALEKLAPLHPIAEKLRDYRTYTKMYTSFVEGVLEKARKVGDGYRVHPEFDPVGTISLRTSCKAPNYQQLPADKAWGKLRGMLIPRPGYKLVSVDYQSLEVYLTAGLSLDPTLMEVCLKGTSFHDATVEGLKQYNITRTQAKTINFAVLYGATEHRISSIAKTSKFHALGIIKAFWSTYPGIKKSVDECHALVDAGKPVETVYGNKRRLSDASNVDKAKRQSFNFLVQSTGAGLTNRSYVACDDALRYNGWGRCLMPVHDEIIAEVREDVAEEGGMLIKQLMEAEARKINLPLELIAVPSRGLSRWEK